MLNIICVMCLLMFKHFDVCLHKVFTFHDGEKGSEGGEGEEGGEVGEGGGGLRCS